VICLTILTRPADALASGDVIADDVTASPCRQQHAAPHPTCNRDDSPKSHENPEREDGPFR
jgi:hypothetical protein